MIASLQILCRDLRAVTRSLFAILILIAVAILPALYAWVNIYANMDPYGATGNIIIAVASRDPGVKLENGETVNKAQEVMDELRESTAIGWQFPDSADAAIAGVRSGEYDFLYSMSDAVHTLHPRHLIFLFQLLGDSLTIGHLGHKPIYHFFSSSINVFQMCVQRTAEKHLCVDWSADSAEPDSPTLAPDSNAW